MTSEHWQHITILPPETADFYYEILETIEKPDIIYEGNSGAKIASKKFNGIYPKFIVTVYKETKENDGFIITAYLSVKKQELEKKKKL